MTLPIVVSTDWIHPSAHELLASHARIQVMPDQSPATYKQLMAQASVLIVRNHLPLGVFAAAPHLLGVVRHGVGLDMIPMEEANRHNIPVANVPGGNSVAVGEYVALVMGMLSHRIQLMDAKLRTGGWAASRALSAGSRNLANRTVGILGLGDVGRAVARICHEGFRMNVIGHQRRLDCLPPFVQAVGLEELFLQSEFLVLACPLTEATQLICSEERIGKMQPGAFLINVGRGGLVNTEAIWRAVNDGLLAGAALDVFDHEPLNPQSPLLDSSRFILTPHAAGLTEESMEFNAIQSAEQTLSLLKGERPQHLVNETVWLSCQKARRGATVAQT